jgi:Ca-activated chloride channel family protein
MTRHGPFELAFLFLLLLPTWVLADGLIIIDRPPQPIPGHFPFAPMEGDVSPGQRVDRRPGRDDQRRPGVPQQLGGALEGYYMFPLPDGAAIDKFSMDIDGKEMEAELLPADKARSIYEDIVRRHRDPALLEYVGQGRVPRAHLPDRAELDEARATEVHAAAQEGFGPGRIHVSAQY